MKCPYRIIETVNWAGGIGPKGPGSGQEFAECYGGECPYYVPESKIGTMTLQEHCRKVTIEENQNRKEQK